MMQWATTERLGADVTLAEGMTIHGDLHLQARVAHRDGPETPLEMLNRPDPFFPMTLENGEVVFVSKAQVAFVACPASPTPPVDPERLSVAKSIGLEVMMRGGRELRGYANTELPPNRARALDYLNGPDPFFDIVIQDFTLFIHRVHVRVARPIR